MLRGRSDLFRSSFFSFVVVVVVGGGGGVLSSFCFCFLTTGVCWSTMSRDIGVGGDVPLVHGDLSVRLVSSGEHLAPENSTRKKRA